MALGRAESPAPLSESGMAGRALAAACHASLRDEPQLLQLRGNVGAGLRHLDLLVDRLDDPFFIDVERPAIGEAAFWIQDAVLLGDALVGIAQNGVIQLERLGELLVLFGSVDAGREISDLEVVERLAVFAERFAFLGASAR